MRCCCFKLGAYCARCLCICAVEQSDSRFQEPGGQGHGGRSRYLVESELEWWKRMLKSDTDTEHDDAG